MVTRVVFRADLLFGVKCGSQTDRRIQEKDMKIRHRLFLLSTAVLLAAATFTQTASAQPKTLQPESRFAKLDGARVHYVSYGKGDDALVLIHGWTQSIDAAW